MDKKRTGCSWCALADHEDGKPVYCRFWGQKVSDKNVCDYFLDWNDSPQQKEILDDIAGTSENTLSIWIKIKDFFGMVCIALIIALEIFVFMMV